MNNYYEQTLFRTCKKQRQQTQLDLEKLRPVLQNIFIRGRFLLLSVALVDLHDAKELMLDFVLSSLLPLRHVACDSAASI